MDKQLKKALDTQFEKLKTEMLETITGLLKKLEDKVDRLENENTELRSRLNAIERYDRGDCLEIHNVPHSSEENLNELVCEIGKQMEVNFTSDDISTTYRIPVAKSNRNKAVAPRIFVKFVRRNTKRQMYAARSKKRVTHQSLGFHTAGKVYLHESLTKAQSQLFFAAKDRVAECGYKYIWTQDQQIYVRATDKSKRISIDSDSDLAKIVALADTDESEVVAAAESGGTSSSSNGIRQSQRNKRR